MIILIKTRSKEIYQYTPVYINTIGAVYFGSLSLLTLICLLTKI